MTVQEPAHAAQPQGPALPPSHGTRLDLRVPAHPSAVRTVRHALQRLTIPLHVLDDARLLLSELVTNSIRHAGLSWEDEVRVEADWSGRRLRVDVWDRAGGTGPRKVAGAIRPDPGSESGWGLFMVESLASRWGATPGRYWFELEGDRAARPRR